MIIDLDDWELVYSDQAAREGWHISEIGPRGRTNLLIETVSGDGSDDIAVSALKRAYDRCEPHARAAYDLIRCLSPHEFKFWKMETWK